MKTDMNLQECGKRADSLIKKRIVYKYDELGDIKEDNIIGKQNVIDIRSNTATLLKEVAIILKEEEEETKKLLDLLVGSPNYLEYEKMIEERIAEEKALFQLKIERLHLEGKLTEKAAVLAKQRLIYESKERRKLFEEERQKYLEDIEKLRQIEKERTLNLFSKVKEIDRRAQFQKQNMLEMKKEEGQRNREKLQKLVKEAIAKGKEEYQKKVLMIKEVRAFQAFKKSLQNETRRKPKESPKLGLLCEMSLEELASRKALMHSFIAEERSKRRTKILERIKEKEDFLDEAENFINKVRRNRRLRKGPKQIVRRESTSDLLSNIPETFLRRIPPVSEEERMYKKKLNQILIMKNEKRDNKIKEIKKRKFLCERKAKADSERLNEILNERFVDRRDKCEARREFLFRLFVEEKFGIKTNENYDDKFGKQLIIRKLAPEINTKKIGKVKIEEKVTVLETKDTMIWEKFKLFVENKTRFKLPTKLKKLTSPPSEWKKKIRRIKRVESCGKPGPVGKKNTKNGKKLRVQRTIRFNASFIKKAKSKRRKKQMRKSEKKLLQLWQWFYKQLMGDSGTKFEGLERLDARYTKEIIAKVNYFYKLLQKKKTEKDKPQVNSALKKYEEEISHLRNKLQTISEKIRKARRRNEISLSKAFTERTRVKSETPLQNRLILPNSNDVKVLGDKYRQYHQRIPDHFVVHQVLAEEDNEIKEAPLQLPFKSDQQTLVWLSESEYEKKQREEKEAVKEVPSGESVIYIWNIPKKRKKKSVKKKKDLPLEFKLLSKYGEKYTLLRNKYGNPVFTLRPMTSNLLKWEWVPVITRKLNKSHSQNADITENIGGDQEVKEALEKIKLVNTAVMNFIKTNVQKHSLLPKMLAVRYQNDDRYLRSLRGKSRQRYFMNVPIRMILDYWKTHQYGGNPYADPPPPNNEISSLSSEVIKS